MEDSHQTSDSPSSIPSSSPTVLGDIIILDSVVLETTGSAFMDTTTILTFENVCESDFLPWYMTRIYSTTYNNIKCTIISQKSFGDGTRLRRRELLVKEHGSIIALTTSSSKILLRVRSTVDLPEEVEFADILEKTFLRYILQFQGLLAEKSLYFVPVEDPKEVAGIEQEEEGTDETDLPKMVIVGSTLLGAALAVSFAILYVRKQKQQKESTTPPRDVTDDSLLLLFDNGLGNGVNEDESFNSYLPPSPFGFGVPMEIGPQSWVEPDDDLSQGSPENQGVEASFVFARNAALQSVLSDKEKIVPKSRTAEILASLKIADTHTSKIPPYLTGSLANGNALLRMVSSGESADDNSKRSLSSRASSDPAKSSSNDTRRTNESNSDASSTLHGLKLVGTIPGYPSSEVSDNAKGELSKTGAKTPSAGKKGSFFRKMMQRKPSGKQIRSPSGYPPKQRKVAGTKEKNAQQQVLSDQSSKKATSGSSSGENIRSRRPLHVETTPSDSSDTPKLDRLQSQSGLFNSNAAGPTQRRQESIITERVTAIAKVFNDMEKTLLSSTELPRKQSNTVSVSSSRAGFSSLYLYNQTKSNLETEAVLHNSEERSTKSLVDSLIRQSQTPQGTPFLQMSTSSVTNVGNVLEDLGRLESEWDDQLESKLSASATTPRRTNSEKFRKGPRQHFHQEDLI